MINRTKEDARSRTFKAFNKNPHWTCDCGIKNQISREECINCGKTLCLDCNF